MKAKKKSVSGLDQTQDLSKVFDDTTVGEDSEESEEEDDDEGLSTSVFNPDNSYLSSPSGSTPGSPDVAVPASSSKKLKFTPSDSSSSTPAERQQLQTTSPSFSKSSRRSSRASGTHELDFDVDDGGMDIGSASPSKTPSSRKSFGSPERKEASKPKKSKREGAATLARRKRDTINRAGEELLNTEDATESRKSKRMKLAPLRHWELEEVNYVRDTSSVVGTMMPTIDRANPVRMVVEQPPSPEKGARVAKPKKKKKKEIEQKKKKLKMKTVDEEQEKLDEEVEREFNSNCWINDVESKGTVYKCVAKTHKMVQMEQLIPTDQSGNILPGPYPLGGKSFDETNFSCGFLDLPPTAVKRPEYSDVYEVFYVRAAEREQLKVVIHRTEFLLSAGDTFVVPRNNLYSMENLSKTTPAKLFFNLVSQE